MLFDGMLRAADQRMKTVSEDLKKLKTKLKIRRNGSNSEIEDLKVRRRRK